MSDSLELDPALVRRLAEMEIANILESKKMLLDEHSASFRWLVASFLAINGGGLIAVAGQANMSRAYGAASGLLFCIGIVSALLCAWLSQRANRATLLPLNEAMGIWISIAHFGELDHSDIKTVESKMTEVVKVSRPTQISGWFSVTAFLLGMCMAGVGYWIAHPPVNLTIHAQ